MATMSTARPEGRPGSNGSKSDFRVSWRVEPNTNSQIKVIKEGWNRGVGFVPESARLRWVPIFVVVNRSLAICWWMKWIGTAM